MIPQKPSSYGGTRTLGCFVRVQIYCYGAEVSTNDFQDTETLSVSISMFPLRALMYNTQYCAVNYAMLLSTVIVPAPLVSLRNRLPPIYRMHRHAGEKTPDCKRAFSIDENHESSIKSLSSPIMFIVVYQHQIFSIVQHYQPFID